MNRALALLLLVLLHASASAAQPAAPERTQSVGAGLQWALPYAGDTMPGAQVSWRRWRSSRMGIGTDVRWWQSATTEELPGMRDEVRRASYGVTASLLGRTSLGRLSLIGGLGPGFFIDRHAHERSVAGLRDAGVNTVRTFGFHGLLDVDVRATNRLSVFAGLRAELRDARTTESCSGYPTMGMRFTF